MSEEPVTLEERTEECNNLHEALGEAFVELLKQDIALTAQRRTIATLRARLAYRAQGYQEDVCFLGDRLNQYYRVGNEFRKHDLHGLHEQRIAAIRNFGALP